MKSGGEELLGLESENTSDLERQNMIGKPTNLEENDAMHEKMMELEPDLEASENATFGESISHMGNARAIAWHRRCGTRITQTSA